MSNRPYLTPTELWELARRLFTASKVQGTIIQIDGTTARVRKNNSVTGPVGHVWKVEPHFLISTNNPAVGQPMLSVLVYYEDGTPQLMSPIPKIMAETHTSVFDSVILPMINRADEVFHPQVASTGLKGWQRHSELGMIPVPTTTDDAYSPYLTIANLILGLFNLKNGTALNHEPRIWFRGMVRGMLRLGSCGHIYNLVQAMKTAPQSELELIFTLKTTNTTGLVIASRDNEAMMTIVDNYRNGLEANPSKSRTPARYLKETDKASIADYSLHTTTMMHLLAQINLPSTIQLVAICPWWQDAGFGYGAEYEQNISSLLQRHASKDMIIVVEPPGHVMFCFWAKGASIQQLMWCDSDIISMELQPKARKEYMGILGRFPELHGVQLNQDNRIYYPQQGDTVYCSNMTFTGIVLSVNALMTYGPDTSLWPNQNRLQMTKGVQLMDSRWPLSMRTIPASKWALFPSNTIYTPVLLSLPGMSNVQQWIANIRRAFEEGKYTILASLVQSQSPYFQELVKIYHQTSPHARETVAYKRNNRRPTGERVLEIHEVQAMAHHFMRAQSPKSKLMNAGFASESLRLKYGENLRTTPEPGQVAPFRITEVRKKRKIRQRDPDAIYIKANDESSSEDTYESDSEEEVEVKQPPVSRLYNGFQAKRRPPVETIVISDDDATTQGSASPSPVLLVPVEDDSSDSESNSDDDYLSPERARKHRSK